MVKKEWVWMYFNDEWNEPSTDNDGGDEDHIDGVDEYLEDKKNTYDSDDYDDYEEYGS